MNGISVRFAIILAACSEHTNPAATSSTALQKS